MKEVKVMEKLLTRIEVQEILNLSAPTIYKLLREGELKGFRVSGRLRFRPKDIKALIEANPSQ